MSHTDIQLACRVRALTLSVATTGSMSLSATATGYARSTGSFMTDGFEVGMELIATGFSAANNAAHIITNVTTGFITVAGGCDVQGSSAGRTIVVGLPSSRAWENKKFTPVAGTVYVEEQYLPGPSVKIGIARTSDIERTPMYQLQIHVADGIGISANGRYADAIEAHFAPLTAFTTATGDVVQVRSDVGPFRGQRMVSATGFNVIPVTIPLRVRTANAVI